MSDALTVITSDIYATREAFQAAAVDRSINFDREATFAIQILTSNDYALKIAMQNRQSVVNAVTNIAAIGLSLNPAKKHAYLVPRDGRICLDISYIGMTELAVASGSVLWVQAAIVHQNDGFQLNGLDRPPTHNFNPFGVDRGVPVGVYVVAKTHDGDYLTECMSVAEIDAIKERSSAWKAWISKKAKCPWVTDYSEMAKKTVVKRASKMWPKTDRLDRATHHLNTDGGEGLAELADNAPTPTTFDPDYWIRRADAAQTEHELVEVYGEAMREAEKAQDRAGAARFKQAAIARRNALREQQTEGEVE